MKSPHAIELISKRNQIIASEMQQQAVVAQEVDQNLLNIRDFSVEPQEVATQSLTITKKLSQVAEHLHEMMKSFAV